MFTEMANDNDDLWMAHPVNYTPWFKWLIKKRQQLLVELIDKAINKCREVTTTDDWGDTDNWHEKYGIGDRRPHTFGPDLIQWCLENGYTVYDKERLKKYLN